MSNEKKELSIEGLKKQLEDCQKAKDEYLAGWQREKADFLNYKKGEMERVGEFLKYANEGLILKILPILDSFEVAEKKLAENLKKDESVKGLLMIKNQILDFLKVQGVEEIKSIGEKFDPNVHEVVGDVPSDLSAEAQRAKVEVSTKEDTKSESGTIIEEIQKGYTINGRLLRPAKVKVTK